MASNSVPSTPTRSTSYSEQPDSPSDKLARARAALFCTPGSQRIGLPSSHSSPLSSGSPKTPESSPPSYKSTHASPTSPTSTSTKRVYSALGSQSRSAADDDNDWRHRAENHGIKVTNDARSEHSSSSSDEQDVFPTPALAHSRTFSEQSPESSLSFYSQLDEDIRTSLFTTPPKRPLSRLRGSVSDPPLTRSRSYTLEHSPERIDASVQARLRAVLHDNDLSPTTDSPLTANNGTRVKFESRPRLNPRFPSIGKSPVSPTVASCSVCGICSSVPARFSILEPCHHLICSNCLTGALNIVREKDMTCVLCRSPVHNFKLLAPLPPSFEESFTQGTPPRKLPTSSPKTTPPSATSQRTRSLQELSVTGPQPALASTVLRVDNVPWDITPKMVAEWVGEPIEAAYTLIDRQSGKTFSHAFIEFSTAEQARAILRKLQNAVLGKGKRTMAVTVTMSSQEELMTELYPSWTGEFIGSSPVLTNYTKLRSQSLPPSLLTHKELDSLVLLLENPNPRFVKSPALPYYELIGILKKIPQQWSSCLPTEVRDHLYNLCSYGSNLLRAQVQQNYNNHPDMTKDLIREHELAMQNCAAFDDSIPVARFPFAPATSTPVKRAPPVAPMNPIFVSPMTSPVTSAARSNMIERFANEFNVHPEIVASLANRLANLGN